jgi:8-amino-7-oxononanoate synthase
VTPWRRLVEERNAAIAATGRWRTIRALDGGGPVFTLADGREVVSFASNDYLGLSQHPAVRAAAVDAIQRWGTGSGSARLIVGDRPVHRALEAELAGWKGAEAAVLFPTGFAANLGVLTAVAGRGTLVVSDERNHASIIDGCRLSRADVAVAAHCDTAEVERHLVAHGGPAVVVTDAVFSMDGDIADLDGLAAVCRRRGALLVVDEAHAVLPPVWHPDPEADVLRVGTLSKTLGALGGFVAGARAFVDLIVNVARPFIFTTAGTPGDAAAALAALGILRSAEGAGLVRRLAAVVDRVAPGNPSPIVPVIVGDEAVAVDTAARLLDDHGLLVPAIRPPPVAPGPSRLRVALSAAHTDDHVERLRMALAALG